MNLFWENLKEILWMPYLPAFPIATETIPKKQSYWRVLALISQQNIIINLHNKAVQLTTSLHLSHAGKTTTIIFICKWDTIYHLLAKLWVLFAFIRYKSTYFLIPLKFEFHIYTHVYICLKSGSLNYFRPQKKNTATWWDGLCSKVYT